MIPAASVTVSCPHCGSLFVDPRYVTYSTSLTHVFSDLETVVYTNLASRPLYVFCRGCARVGLRASFAFSSAPQSVRRDRWVEATPEQAIAALDAAYHPFSQGSGEAHELRLYLWRVAGSQIRAGIPIKQSAAHLNMLEALLAECESRSYSPSYRWTAAGVERLHETVSVPVYRFLSGEIHRQRREFSEAALIFRSIHLNAGDVLLGYYSQQQEIWCRESVSVKQPLLSLPARSPRNIEKPKGNYKFVVAATVRVWRDSVSDWVKFPDGGMTVEDVTCLPAAASMCCRLAGIVLLESDVSARWPGPSDTEEFLKTLVKVSRAAPWLIVGALLSAKSLAAALRGADFPASGIEPGQLNHARFEAWALHGKRRAEKEWRRSLRYDPRWARSALKPEYP